MKTSLFVPILLCVVPIVSIMSSLLEPIPHRAMANPAVYEGKIAGWSVSVDGTVAVRLAGTREGEEFSLWFATPASRNATTRYESLVLEAVLACRGPGQHELVTVVTDSSNEASGKSVEQALALSSIGHP